MSNTRKWVILIGLIVLSPALLFLFLGGSTIYEHLQMQSWLSTKATLTRVHYDVNSEYRIGEKHNTTYLLEAEYTYHVNGQNYQNNRVGLSSTHDDISDGFQGRAYHELNNKYKKQQKIILYYAPDNPQNAIIYREIRWWKLFVYLLFIIPFGGFGMGILYLGLGGKVGGARLA
jgi:hypothetical protein